MRRLYVAMVVVIIDQLVVVGGQGHAHPGPDRRTKAKSGARRISALRSYDLLTATEKLLVGIEAAVERRTKTPLTAAEIGKKVGATLNRFKMAKRFILTMRDGFLPLLVTRPPSAARRPWTASMSSAPVSPCRATVF